MNQWFFVVLIVVIIIVALAMSPPLPSHVGQVDYRAYWSASYLLVRSENFSDPMRLFQVEQTETDYQENSPLMTWNPPWLLVLMIPFTFVPFARASWWWLLISIALIFAGSVLVWRKSARTDAALRFSWIAPLIALFFPPTLIALLIGQVSTIVFAGLAAFVFFETRSPVVAGAALALTSVKPQLVFVTLPLVLLELLVGRRWRVLGSFCITLLGLTAIAFLLRPTLITEYSHTVGGGGLFSWETPTLGGFLHRELDWGWAKLSGIIVLPLAASLWWRHRKALAMHDLVDLTVVASMVFAPFGWSFDFVVLLLPLLRASVWVFEGRFDRGETLALMLALFAVYAVSLYQRIIPGPEVQFFWIPLVIAGIYLWVRIRCSPRVQIGP